jgi:uncharacterized protein
MRLQAETSHAIKQTVLDHAPEAQIYLFGSKAHNKKKGGDIDILIIAPRKLSLSEKMTMKIALYKAIGYRKIDLVSFTGDEISPFKTLALASAVRL